MSDERHAINTIAEAPTNPAQRRTSDQNTPWRAPSVAVRETADGADRPSQLRTPTVVTAQTDRPNRADGRPLDVRGQRNMTVHSATR
jgi:hypothetical protein